MQKQSNQEHLILGVDPGTRITGYGIVRLDKYRQFSVVDYGCIRPPSSLKIEFRYRVIFESICALIRKFSPSALSLESQFVNKNPQSTLKLGMAKGMIILAAALQEIPVFEYAPSRAKKAVVGTGRASKIQVQGMMKHLLKLAKAPEPEDAADALALAICHGQTLCMNTFVES